MRLFLLPLSTRRVLLYAQRPKGTPASAEPAPSLIDKTTAWAATKWAQWEKRDSGWQRKVVDYGNHAFRRIPYQEWALKSVPARRGNDERSSPDKVELIFPSRAFSDGQAPAVVLKLATERLGLHRKRIFWCFAGMPITAPFALIPIIPNLPFFYLVYRAWSHWRALRGGQHLQWLVEHKRMLPSPSTTLDKLYGPNASPHSPEEVIGREQMLLTVEQVRTFSETLEEPELEIELERALWQVSRELGAHQPDSASSAETRPEADRWTPGKSPTVKEDSAVRKKL